MTRLERITRARMLQPLQRRDFVLLSGGSLVSLLGDGFFYIALAWQVYSISNVPTALSIVGVFWTLPSVLFVLLGGALSDRFDRRRLMIGADLIRAAAIGTMAVLSATGAIQLWHVVALIIFVGAGDAFFNPASTAIVPDLVLEDELPAANALGAMYRNLMQRLLGPALAGIIIAAFGPAAALGYDGLSFVVSAVAVLAIRTRPAPRPTAAGGGVRETIAQVAEGVRYARSKAWIWATLLTGMFALLVFLGPVEVLVPFLLKNRLSLGPDSLGLVFAVGGIGSMAMSVLVGVVGLPRLRVTIMYAAFALGVAVTAGFGVMTALWQAMLITFVVQGAFQLGQVIWTTMLQQLVPRDLLGRIASLDWMVSTALVPVSFALTGPVSAVLGPETTVIGAAVLGALLMGGLLFLPGVRDPERSPEGRSTIAAAAGGIE
jgi:DHA3 family tetracycline resistance protein-like MFS transporter